MKNLKPYPGGSFSFYCEVTAAKTSPDIRSRLETIKDQLEESYIDYDRHFSANTLEKLAVSKSYLTHKADLLALYNYQFSVLKELRLAIAQEQPRNIRHTCQHCTLTSIESMDHFVPKEEFPEFAVNPYNLIPSCGKCNQHKSNKWRKNSKRTALNLYLDRLPQTQYLFVDIIKDQYDEIDFRFYLDNKTSISSHLFELISNHYDDLNLFARMREKAIPVITELQNTILHRSSGLPFTIIRDEIIQVAHANSLSFGPNYWKSIVEIAMIDSPLFQELI